MKPIPIKRKPSTYYNYFSCYADFLRHPDASKPGPLKKLTQRHDFRIREGQRIQPLIGAEDTRFQRISSQNRLSCFHSLLGKKLKSQLTLIFGLAKPHHSARSFAVD